jgi:hypothetical protein
MKLQCELEIQQNLDLLIGDEDLASETTIRVDTPGVSQPVVDTRTASRPYPGDSVLPGSIKSGLLRNRTLGNN